MGGRARYQLWPAEAGASHRSLRRRGQHWLLTKLRSPWVSRRGKAGRVQGSMAGTLAVMKGTPTTYNKDFQVRLSTLCTTAP